MFSPALNSCWRFQFCRSVKFCSDPLRPAIPGIEPTGTFRSAHTASWISTSREGRLTCGLGATQMRRGEARPRLSCGGAFCLYCFRWFLHALTLVTCFTCNTVLCFGRRLCILSYIWKSLSSYNVLRNFSILECILPGT